MNFKKFVFILIIGICATLVLANEERRQTNITKIEKGNKIRSELKKVQTKEEKYKLFIKRLKIRASLRSDMRLELYVTLVDKKNKQVTGVEAIIEKGVFGPNGVFGGDGKVIKEKKILSTNPSVINFSDCYGGDITLKKEGYYSVKVEAGKGEIFDKAFAKARKAPYKATTPEELWMALSERIMSKTYKKSIKVILRKISKLPKVQLLAGDMFFWHRKKSNGTIINKGWSYKPDENGFIAENVAYTNPSEVDFYMERSEDKTKLYFISNDKNSGFYPMGNDVKDLTYLDMAPEKGYKRKIEIKKVYRQCFYFRIHGKYGKMEICLPNFKPKKKMYGFHVDFFINPSGSRNVTTLNNF